MSRGILTGQFLIRIRECKRPSSGENFSHENQRVHFFAQRPEARLSVCRIHPLDLPLVDEFVIALGQSEDDTEKMLREIGDPKIRIIPTQWNERIQNNY